VHRDALPGAAGAGDRDLRRHHDQVGEAATKHPEVRQREGGAAQLVGRIERAAASARIRSSPARRSRGSRSPTLRGTGTIRPTSVSTAIPTSWAALIRYPDFFLVTVGH
jgi:hypothetical protein